MPLYNPAISVLDTASVDLTLSAAGILSAAVLPAGVDHGGLGGLTDDDHTQYLLIDGTRLMTGNLTFVGTAQASVSIDRSNNAIGRNLTIKAGAPVAAATNANGGALVLSSGICTGTGVAQITFQATGGGSTGTADTVPVIVATMTTDGTTDKLKVGRSGTSNGVLELQGSTSGYVQLVPTAAAGSVIITLPATAGTVALTANTLAVFAATTSAQLAGVISDETGSGALVFGTSPTFTTSITAPLIIGGTGTTDDLILRATSGAGTTGSLILFQVGNNGATEAGRITDTGKWGIGTTAPLALLSVGAGSLTDSNVPIQVSSQGAGTAGFFGLNKNGGYGLLQGYDEGTVVTGGCTRMVSTDSYYIIVNNTTIAATVTSGGLFGIGITPTTKFHVLGADNTTAVTIGINATQANITGADKFVSFTSTTGEEANVIGTGVLGVIAYNTFTGSHWSQGKLPPEISSGGLPLDIIPGTVLVSLDALCEWEGQINNHLPRCAISTQKKDKAVYGVFGGLDGDGDVMVLAIGSGVILVSNEGGPIEVGDLLCTATLPGHAMRYDGNKIELVVAKARQSFNGVTGIIACTLMGG